MLLNNKKIFFNNLTRLVGIISLAITIILMFFFPDSNNPDWDSYKILYERADYYLTFSRSNYLYLFLSSFLNNFLSYKSFRVLLLIAQLSIFSWIFKNSKYKISKLNIFICLPLIAFLILKVHIQVREGLALLIYFCTLLDLKNIRILSIKTIFLTLLSLLIHPGLLIIWIPTIILIKKLNLSNYKKFLIYLFFFLIALFSINTYFRLFINGTVNKIYSQGFTFREYQENYSLEINFQKISYWFSYLILFLVLYCEELRMKSIALSNITLNKISYVFGAISLNGLVVYLPSIFVLSIFININSLDYNLIYRITSLLFFLLIIYRSLTYPKRLLTRVLSVFFSIDIIRIVFQFIN